MEDISKKIFKACADYGVKMDFNNRELMRHIEGFDGMPTIKKYDDKIVFDFWESGRMQCLQIKRNGEYSYSAGVNMF